MPLRFDCSSHHSSWLPSRREPAAASHAHAHAHAHAHHALSGAHQTTASLMLLLLLVLLLLLLLVLLLVLSPVRNRVRHVRLSCATDAAGRLTRPLRSLPAREQTCQLAVHSPHGLLVDRALHDGGAGQPSARALPTLSRDHDAAEGEVGLQRPHACHVLGTGLFVRPRGRLAGRQGLGEATLARRLQRRDVCDQVRVDAKQQRDAR